MKPLKRLLVPRPYELIGYATVAFLLLSLSNLPAVFHLLIGQEARPTLQPIFDDYAYNLTTTINSIRFLGTASTGLFWAVVGAVVYGILWTGWNMYLEVHNDIEIGSHFLNPSEQAHSQFWYHKIGRTLFRIGMGVVILGFTLMTVRLLYPLAVEYFRAFITDWSNPKNWLYTLESLLGTTAVLYGYAMLFRLLFGRIRVFTQSY